MAARSLRAPSAAAPPRPVGARRGRAAGLWAHAARRLGQNRLALGGLAYVVLVALAALTAPVVAPYPYDLADFAHLLEPPSRMHVLGTDQLGRDLLSRLLFGARVSLTVGILAALLAVGIGTVYGTVSGLVGGRVDHLMMRVIDVIYALPDLVIIILLSVLIGRGLTGILLALSLVAWAGAARLVRGQVLHLKGLAFLEAAEALGASPAGLFVRHVLPNILGVLTVALTIGIPTAILAESTLSFLGLGLAPPASSWGTLAAEGWKAFRASPHLILFPSLAIFTTILALNLLGDGLRDALDPRHGTRRP